MAALDLYPPRARFARRDFSIHFQALCYSIFRVIFAILQTPVIAHPLAIFCKLLKALAWHDLKMNS